VEGSGPAWWSHINRVGAKGSGGQAVIFSEKAEEKAVGIIFDKLKQGLLFDLVHEIADILCPLYEARLLAFQVLGEPCVFVQLLLFAAQDPHLCLGRACTQKCAHRHGQVITYRTLTSRKRGGDHFFYSGLYRGKTARPYKSSQFLPIELSQGSEYRLHANVALMVEYFVLISVAHRFHLKSMLN